MATSLIFRQDQCLGLKKMAMAPLFNLDLSWDDFPEEKGQSDGTIAHAIERLLGIVPRC